MCASLNLERIDAIQLEHPIMAAAPVPPPGPPGYLHNIMSVQAKNPKLPLLVGQLNLDRAIHAGEPVDHDNLSYTNTVAEALRGAAGM